jgi:hypothetical protein
MVDEAYHDQDDWVKRSICTTAKASEYLFRVPSPFSNVALLLFCRWANLAPIVLSMSTQKATGISNPCLSLVRNEVYDEW